MTATLTAPRIESDPILRPSDAINLAGQDTGRGHLSHSELSTQLSCLRKYQFHYRDRLELRRRRAPLELGAAYQKAIEHQDAALAAKELRESRAPLIATQADENQLQIDEMIVTAAATLYLKKWRALGTREYEYRIRLRSPWTGQPSRTFDLLGYVDELHDSPHGLELVENKLVGQISASDIRRLPLNRQIALERYGVWRATGREIVKVRYRFVRKPSIKQKQGERLDEFLKRLASDYETRPEFYAREENPYVSNADLLDLECELWEWAEQLRHAQHRGFFTRNTSVCHEYGGCSFLPICLGDPDARSLYQVRAERPRLTQSTSQDTSRDKSQEESE